VRATNRNRYWGIVDHGGANKGNRKLAVFRQGPPEDLSSWTEWFNLYHRRLLPASLETMRLVGCEHADTDGKDYLTEAIDIMITTSGGSLDFIGAKDDDYPEVIEAYRRLSRRFMRARRCHVNGWNNAYFYVCYCDES